MATIMDNLTDILEKQILLYDDLLAISKEKKKVLLENNVETLTTMNTVENTIISKINRLEKQRLEVVKDICDVLAMNQKNFGLSELADTLNNEEDKNKILEIRERFNDITNQLNEANEVNKNLIQNSLEYVNFTINTIRSVNQPMETGYENEIKGK